MSKKIFVTGTGTEIGKTYVAGLMVKKLAEANLKSAYYKAAMSGNERDEKGALIPGDANFVKDFANIEEPLEKMCPYIYERAVSPHLASQIEGNPVDLGVVIEKFEELRFDKEKIFLEDFIKKANLSCVIVADAGLGTINDVVLTAFYMKENDIDLKGIIFNNFIPGDLMQEDNIKMCKYMTGSKVIACVKEGDKNLDIDVEDLKKIYE